MFQYFFLVFDFVSSYNSHEKFQCHYMCQNCFFFPNQPNIGKVATSFQTFFILLQANINYRYINKTWLPSKASLFLYSLTNASGLEIWCIENLQLVPVSKSSHGKFYCGSSYVVLHVSISVLFFIRGWFQHWCEWFESSTTLIWHFTCLSSETDSCAKKWASSTWHTLLAWKWHQQGFLLLLVLLSSTWLKKFRI